MSKKVSPPFAALPSEEDKAREAVAQTLKGMALETRFEEEFDAALELLVGKRPRHSNTAYLDKSRLARKALREFVANGPYAKRPRRTVKATRALALAQRMEKASASLRNAMDEFLAELREYADGPVLYAGAEIKGHVLFRISFFGLDDRALDPGARVPEHQKTRFRLDRVQEYARLIVDSLLAEKGGARTLENRENGKLPGRLVLAAADMYFDFAPPYEITKSSDGPFMKLCFELLALAQRPDREERRLRDYVEFGAPRLREVHRLMREAEAFDADAAVRQGIDHPYFKAWTRVFELRREIGAGPPSAKKKRRTEANNE